MCQFCGDFTHLHFHTNFSLLDGASNINDAVSYVKNELNQTSLAITDHGAMFGVYDFYKAAKKIGIKPIIGMEGYLARRGRFDKDKDLDKRPFHQVMLAENNIGYRNLMAISSDAWKNGFYSRPRTDKDFLIDHKEGLILTSSCIASEVASLYLKGSEEEAIEQVLWWDDVFKGSFYLELQYRLKSKDQHKLNKWLIGVSLRYDIPMIATTDAHYVRQRDADIHDTLLCIQTGAMKSDINRMKFDENTYYAVDTDTMKKFFVEVPSAITNTSIIADRCDVTLGSKKYHLPEYPLPKGYNDKTFIRELVGMGVNWRYGDNIENGLQERIDYELSVIDAMGFNSYFLVVWDLCEYARQNNVWWNVRGSGAGSVVAYCLGITSIDPIINGLFFERFLNPDRISMPDIDLDFQEDKRGGMVNYIVLRYGNDRVSSIITFGTLGAKMAIRDVGRTLNASKDDVDKLAGMVANHTGKTHLLKEYYDESPELKKYIDSSTEAKTIFDTAVSLQGNPRHTSQHAAGIIVAPTSLTDYVPLSRYTGKNVDTTRLSHVTQFPMETLEELGLLKIDVLGLSTLTVMQLSCDTIKKRHGIDLNIDTIPHRHTGNVVDDKMLDDAFDFIASGKTAGIFQIEGSGITDMLSSMKPKTFEDITAAIALFRPGPMGIGAHDIYIRRKNGQETFTYKHPKLESILKETFGLIVYQEQIMQIASQLFGYPPSEADMIRKSVSKAREDELMKHKSRFMQRGPENGVSEDVSAQIWEEILYFGKYGFNKAHSADYAKICVQTAFLKTHYTLEFMLALLQVYSDNKDRLAHQMLACRDINIDLLPPDINKSDYTFSVENYNGKDCIRFGLTQVKTVGEKPASAFINVRPKGGYKSFDEMFGLVNCKSINKTAFMNLINVGVFKSLIDTNKFLSYFESLRKASERQWKHSVNPKQKGLFHEEPSKFNFDTLINDNISHTPSEYLEMEKELLGVYVTARPTDRFIDIFAKQMATPVSYLLDNQDSLAGLKTTVGGMILRIHTVMTKNGRFSKEMAFIDIEDYNPMATTIKTTLFPKIWDKYKGVIKEGDVVTCKGDVDTSRNGLQIIVDDITIFERSV